MRKLMKEKKNIIIVASFVMLVSIVGFSLIYSFKSKASEEEMIAVERLKACRDKVQSELYGEEGENSIAFDEKVRAIVTLEDEAVADNNNVSEYTSNLKSKENEIIKDQNYIIKEVERITGNKVINQTGYLINSFSIDATRRDMKSISKIDGVKSVTEAVTYKTYMNSAVVEGNVKAQLEDAKYGYTGEGVVIAVIDTGVNYKHQDMALDTGVTTKFSEEEWKQKIELLGYGSYMSDKVPFGYNYVTGEDSCLNSEGEHGYHVSSIAAANGGIDGVAKNAQVLGLNVFGKRGYATSDDIVAAIEDAVKLGADIINLSLGYDMSVVSNDYEQMAIDNATQEGVICCVAAGNSATSSSDSGPKNLLNLKDTAMVGSLAVTNSSLAVASAENTRINNDNDESFIEDKNVRMSQFSSWGPTNELGIKPEITAPGGEIKAACKYEDEYAVLSGTSMASPYIAGSQAVMLNAIKERGLDLEGEELTRFLKNSLMNTADVIIDNSNNIPYSVRYQGAGMVDVYGAVDNDVLVTYNDEAKVELGDFEEDITFDLEIRNYGDETCTYTLNNTQVYADYTDNSRWAYGIQPVESAFISYSMNEIVVEPGESVSVMATVNLSDNYAHNSFVEAFIVLEGKECQNIGLPLLGFYGDWDEEPIIDRSLYDEEKSVINTNLTYEKNEIGSYIALINEDVVEKAGLGVRRIDDNQEDVENNNDEKLEYNITNFDLVPLKENMECDIKYKSMLAEFSIEVEEDGYYTFELKDTLLSEITFKQEYDKKYGDYDNTFVIKGMGNLSKEVRLYKGRKYRLKLHLLKKGLYSITQGSIKFYKSNGDDAYTTEYVYDGELSSFSPNGDNINDSVTPSLVMLRCAKEIQVNVLDSNRDIIRTIADVKDVAKTTFRMDGYAFDGLVGRPHESLLYNNIENTYAVWDGKLYNKQTGEYEYADEGQYYIQVIAKRADDAKPYTMEMPVKIDNIKPQIRDFSVTKVNNDTILEFNANDNHSLKSNYFIDIEERTQKGIDTYTFEKKYLETNLTDDGKYVLNLGNLDATKITLLVEDMAGNLVFEEYEGIVEELDVEEEKPVVDVDLTDKDDSISDDSTQIDVDRVELSMTEASYNLKSKPYSTSEYAKKTEEIVLVDKKENDTYTFEIKVNGENSQYNIEELFHIFVETDDPETKHGMINVPFKVKYENNNTIFIEMEDIPAVTILSIEWESDISNYSKTYNITTSKIRYKEMCDNNVVKIDSNLEGISTIDNTMLNEDGTLSVIGKIYEMPEKLTINEEVVEVNPETLEFRYNVNIKKGQNFIGIEATIGGIQYFRGSQINYEEITISIDGLNIGIDEVIHTDNEIFNLTGIIKSYSTVLGIEINGNKVYASSDYKITVEDNPYEMKFDYSIKLNKGINKIKMVVKTGTFKTEEKIITVNYM